ncbi:twin transmembrane helix small protein [Zavarzinia sp. CC-PAN008]|uniref:twin transmembrane helix small protein n=1 Tax=Zavarzinia sp. CC-PAN008 TaxID=3243332 RepID=UPI003F746AF4
MEGPLSWLLPIVILGVVAVLFAGIYNLVRARDTETPERGRRSQMLMRWRVGLQALAILVILLLMWMGQR